MQAIVYHTYGSPHVLRCEDMAKPTVGEDQTLLKVCVASVDPHD